MLQLRRRPKQGATIEFFVELETAGATGGFQSQEQLASKAQKA